MAEAFTLLIASPLKTPWVTSAYIAVAPSRFSSLAARVRVFAVSAKSSISTQVLPATLPTSIIVAFWRSVIFVGRRSYPSESRLSDKNTASQAYLVNESEASTKRLSNCSSALRTTRIGADNHGILVVGDPVLDVVPQEGPAVEIVDGHIEEALVLRVVQIECDDMIRSGTSQKIRN
jgi:hypothetical protein